MSAVTFDTLKFVRTLEAAGMPAPHAEAISIAVQGTHETAEVATQNDLREQGLHLEIKIEKGHASIREEIAELRGDIDKRFAEFRGDIDKRFAEVRGEISTLGLRMTVRLGSMMVVAIGVVAALVKLL